MLVKIGMSVKACNIYQRMIIKSLEKRNIHPVIPVNSFPNGKSIG